MALVPMKAQWWGQLVDQFGNGLATRTVTLKLPNGVNATHYADAAGASSSTASMTTDPYGRLTRYVEEGFYQLDISGSGTYEVEAELDRKDQTLRGGAMLVGTEPSYVPPNVSDGVIGAVEPGQEGRGASGWALRVGGAHFNSESKRWTFQSMVRVVETSDPAEQWVARTPGINKAIPTGGDEYDRKHPVGISTIVSVAAAASATQLYIVEGGWGVPGAWDSSFTDVECLADGQQITWTSKSSFGAWLSGAAAFGDTELKITEAATALPDAGVAWMSNGNPKPRWTGRAVIFDGAADGLHKAGVASVVAKNVTAGEFAAIPAAGSLRVAAGLSGTDIRRWPYTAVSYDAGTSKATFTFAATVVDRNLLDNASIQMHKLTGVTSEFQMPTLGDARIGDTELTLNYDHGHGAPPVQAEIDKIPSSGWLRVETRNDAPTGPGMVDFPVKRIQYSAFDGQTLTLSAPLAYDVPGDSWLWVEGCPGLMRAQVDGLRMRFHRLNGVAGLASGVDPYDIVEFDPRYRSPGGSGNIGFLAGVVGSPSGLTNKNAQISLQALEDAIDAKQRGGEIILNVTVPATGFRRQTASFRSRGVSILGGGLTGGSTNAHQLHVADWGCRTQAPGNVLCDPDDEDCDTGSGGQILSSTLYVTQVTGALSTGRIVLGAYNRETGGSETIELDYTGTAVDSNKLSTLTGVTLASVTGYVLGDYFVDSGTQVKYADSQVSQAIGSLTGLLADKGRPTETILGIGGIYRDANGNLVHVDKPVRLATQYRLVNAKPLRAQAANVTTAAVHMVQSSGLIVVQATAGATADFFYIDPDDFSVAGYSTKLRLVAACAVNDTAPAMTLTIGLYPVTNLTGGVNVNNPNFGTVISGSTIAFASPAANSESAQTYTSDFNLPAEGWYGLGVNASAAMAANSVAILPVRLEVRNV